MKKMNLIYLDDDVDDLDHFRWAVDNLEGVRLLYTTTDSDLFFEYLEASRSVPTIVFLDINMPLKNGFDVLREIRKDKENDKVVVVMHSTATDPNSIAVSRDLGANYYSAKPSSLKGMKSIILSALGHFGNAEVRKDFGLLK